ncbi:MAG: TolC family protein, partial [Planctomycetota bacterium]
LAAAAWDVRAADARTLKAGLLPNPELELELEEFGGEDELKGFRGSELTLGLSQEILLGGKVGKRTEVARLLGSLTGWEYEAARLGVLTETTKAFVAVLAAQERVAVLEESVRLAEEMVRSVSAQVAAGKVARLEESRAGVALSLQKLARDRARRELQARRRELSSSWGGAAPQFEKAEGDLYSTRDVPSPERLEALLEQNPDVARWSVEIELHRAKTDLSRAGRYPDLTVAGGVMRFEESDSHAFVAGISLPLPVFDRSQGDIREARAEARSARERQRAAAARVQMELNTAYQDLAVAAGEAKTLETEVLPVAQTAFVASEEGFRQGKFGYLEVLDAQRTLFETKEQLVAALAAYHFAVADVERLIGQSLASIGKETPDAR